MWSFLRRILAAASLSILLIPAILSAADPPAPRSSERAAADAGKQSADAPVWLCDLQERDVQVGWGSLGKKGQSGYIDQPIAVNGILSPHGLGPHPDSTVSYQLDKKYRGFQATAAVNDSTRGFGHPVLFRVEVDGKQIWESRGMQNAHECQPVVLDITGADRLTLKTLYDPKAEGNGNWAHVAWIEPCVMAGAPDPALVRALDPQKFLHRKDREEYCNQARSFVYQGKFNELEDLAVKAREATDQLEGFPRLHWLYATISHSAFPGEAEQLQYLEALKQWSEAQPDSPLPVVGAAELWLEMANSLKAGATRPLGEEAQKLFDQRIAESEELCQRAKKLAKDPEFYILAMALAAIKKAPAEDLDQLADEALKLNPHDPSSYMIRAAALLPRNGGKPGDLARYAATMRQRLGGHDGALAYARIALVDLNDSPVRYRDSGYSPEQLRTALVEYCRDVAAVRWESQLACHIVCEAGDMPTARAIFQQISPGDSEDSIWGSARKMEDWRTKASAAEAVDH